MSKQERELFANRIKTECVLVNYGLPERSDLLNPPLDNLGIDEAREKILAIRELWVRLDLWVATGKAGSGVIDYPQAKRYIKYDLRDKNPASSIVVFKSNKNK